MVSGSFIFLPTIKGSEYLHTSSNSAVGNVDNWYQDFYFRSEINSVTSIEYDSFFDMYWIGYCKK